VLYSIVLVGEILVVLHGLDLSSFEFLEGLLLFDDFEVEGDEFALISGLKSIELLTELSFDKGLLDLRVFEALGKSLDVP
jgi:hypothetical protein